MNTKNVLSQGFASRSILMFSSVALSSVALAFTLYKSGPVTKTFAATPADKCIVTISGVQYDLTALGTMHSGPQGTTLTGPAGFFQCGTDMTAVYQSQHGTNMSRLAPYVYTAPAVTTPTPTPVVPGTGSPTPTPSISPTLGTTPTASASPTPTPHVEDHDDDEHEDRQDDEHNEKKEAHSDSDESKQEDHHENDDSHTESHHASEQHERHTQSRTKDSDKKSTH